MYRWNAVCLETGMRGVNRGKSRRQYQGLTYRYYLLILRKDAALLFNFMMTKNIEGDIRDLKIPSWKDIVAAVIEEKNGPVPLQDLYRAIEGHKKTASNHYWMEKIRQTLYINSDLFEQVGRGKWIIKNVNKKAS